MAQTGEVQAKSLGYKKINPDAGKATRFKPGQSGNPAGQPKGLKHINTWVQELMEDEEFEALIYDARAGVKEFKGAPLKAIIKAQMIKAINGDTKAYDSLVRSGWSQKQEIDTKVTMVQPIMGLEDTNALSGDDSDSQG